MIISNLEWKRQQEYVKERKKTWLFENKISSRPQLCYANKQLHNGRRAVMQSNYNQKTSELWWQPLQASRESSSSTSAQTITTVFKLQMMCRISEDCRKKLQSLSIFSCNQLKVCAEKHRFLSSFLVSFYLVVFRMFQKVTDSKEKVAIKSDWCFFFHYDL